MSFFQEVARRWRGRSARSERRVAEWRELEPIWRRRFRGTDQQAFLRIWCEVASICGVDPSELHEEDSLAKLCGAGRTPVFSGKMQALEALTLIESKDLPAPKAKPHTVGDLMDYLLHAEW